MKIHLRIKKQTETTLIATLNPTFRFFSGFLALLLGTVIIRSKEFAILPTTLCLFSLLSTGYFETWICDKTSNTIRHKMGLLIPFKHLTIPLETIASIGYIPIPRGRGFTSRTLSRSVITTTDGKLITIEITPQKNSGIASTFAEFLDIRFDNDIEITTAKF